MRQCVLKFQGKAYNQLFSAMRDMISMSSHTNNLNSILIEAQRWFESSLDVTELRLAKDVFVIRFGDKYANPKDDSAALFNKLLADEPMTGVHHLFIILALVKGLGIDATWKLSHGEGRDLDLKCISDYVKEMH